MSLSEKRSFEREKASRREKGDEINTLMTEIQERSRKLKIPGSPFPNDVMSVRKGKSVTGSDEGKGWSNLFTRQTTWLGSTSTLSLSLYEEKATDSERGD